MRAGVVRAAGLVVACVGCGNDGPAVYSPSDVRGDPMMIVLPDVEPVADVAAADNQFRADALEVAPGTPVRWTNIGRIDHDVLAVDQISGFGAARDVFAPGDEYTYLFVEPGEYRYYCSLHGSKSGAGMAGTVTVTGG